MGGYSTAVSEGRGADRFSERDFYRHEFRGRTMGVTVPDASCASEPRYLEALRELADNDTKVILIAASSVPKGLFACPELSVDMDRLEGAVWRSFQSSPLLVLRATGKLSDAVLHTTTRLGLFKVVRISGIAGVTDDKGKRKSFADLSALEPLFSVDVPHAKEQRSVLREVQRLLRAGVPCVNVCRPDALYDELFSYSGSGTLFTRERYVNVRRFGIEDYDAAADLIARGTADGFLAPRSDAQIDALLADGFGAFAGGQHLAGIGALRVPPGSSAGEVASLYTVTRFAGGGVGYHLVVFALDEAHQRGLEFAYACTTSQRVGRFFEGQGFDPVGPEAIPPEKWEGYDMERRSRILCYRYDL